MILNNLSVEQTGEVVIGNSHQKVKFKEFSFRDDLSVDSRKLTGKKRGERKRIGICDFNERLSSITKQ